MPTFFYEFEDSFKMLDKANDEYKQRVIAEFNSRTNYDDDFRYRLATRLVEIAELQRGQTILDVATGTGIAAIYAAEIVGDEGKVIGVDISSGMLSQAQRKIEQVNLKNIELMETDADYLNFENESFDVILCSSAIVYLTDILSALRSWYRFLKPGGKVGFSTFPKRSHTLAELFMAIAQNYGISLPDFKAPLDTPDKCQQMLQNSGFKNIEIKIEQFGYYAQQRDVEKTWNALINNALIKPMLPKSPKQLEGFKVEYFAQCQLLVTEKGIWEDIPTFFALARK